MKGKESTRKIAVGKLSDNSVAVLYLSFFADFSFHYFNKIMNAGKRHFKEISPGGLLCGNAGHAGRKI